MRHSQLVVLLYVTLATSLCAFSQDQDASKLQKVRDLVNADGFDAELEKLLPEVSVNKRLKAIEIAITSANEKERFVGFLALQDFYKKQGEKKSRVSDAQARRLAFRSLPQSSTVYESVLRFSAAAGSKKAVTELVKRLRASESFDQRQRRLSWLIDIETYDALDVLTSEFRRAKRVGFTDEQYLEFLNAFSRLRGGSLKQDAQVRKILQPLLDKDEVTQDPIAAHSPVKTTVAYRASRVIERHLPGFRASLPRELAREYEVEKKQRRVFEYVKRLRAWLKKYGEDPIKGWRAQLAKKMRTISQAPATYRALRDPIVGLGSLLGVPLGMPNYRLEAKMTPNRVKLLQNEVTAWYEKWKGKPYAQMRKAAAKAHERISKAVLDLKPIEPPKPRKLTEEEKEKQRWQRLKKESKKYQAEHERKRQELLRRKREQTKKTQEKNGKGGGSRFK